jgi:hypothetical protein
MFGADAPMHVTLTPHKNGRCLLVEVRKVLAESVTPAPKDKPWLDDERGMGYRIWGMGHGAWGFRVDACGVRMYG